MLLYQELWNLIYEGKKHGRLPKTNLKTLIYNGKSNNIHVSKQLKILNKFIAWEL